ncbi:serine/threonine-protein kinase [Lipingzhangella sp. LS1_29]|uniref:Serine/threonine-protein kinase n=1 Tax=Lipingzhangella rawalii TaxID=2055835 RepID=A0ABU2H6R4_9ACTN|nr:serine/threonine-protein kinase [Lipingzhangella rawalii]MDS1270515.1 serine/threonine-protein kinase [Lipingzhangella rawalii]
MVSRGLRRLQRLRATDPDRVHGFRLVGRVGSGGMGTVYAATAEGVRGYVALKVIHPEHSRDARFRAQFAREARALAQVDSRCVARFVLADVTAPQPWLATEYVPGPTLRGHVTRHRALHGDTLRGFALGTAEGVRAVHTAGLIHRDLKPGNVILGAAGPKLVDFGVAYPRRRGDATRWLRLRRARRRLRERRLAQPGDPVPVTLRPGPRDRLGTPGWISPEQYRGAEVGPASDVYQWGCVVAFAASGRDPFGQGPPEELRRRVLEESPDLDRLVDPLTELVPAAMSRAAEDRPTPSELVDALLPPRPHPTPGYPAAVGATLAQVWPGRPERLPKPPREWPWTGSRHRAGRRS